MGHVHLTVRDSTESSRFYEKMLDLKVTFSLPTVSWIASGNYRHHRAVNEWASSQLKESKEGRLGLAYFIVYANDEDIYNKINENIIQMNANIVNKTSNQVEIKDMNNIHTVIINGYS